jgi:hypothetical protein
MRILALLLLGALASGCARHREPASQTHATESHRVRVKFRSAFAVPHPDMNGREIASMEAERAIIERMRGAGYDVVDHGHWDVRMELNVRVHDDEHADATAVFYDQKDRVVDRMSVATGPKRVAGSFVDEVRDSKKLKAKTSSK